MKRIDTATKAVDKFGAGKHGFTNGNVVSGIPATDLTDSWFDNVQEEVANVIEGAGIALDGSVKTQLLQALRVGPAGGIDTGAANAVVVNYSPSVAALVDGMVLRFKAAAANTGATTLNINGLGARAIVGAGHFALQGGEIVANGKCEVVWSATLNAFVLIECTGASIQVASATQSNQAVNFGQLLGMGQSWQDVTAARGSGITYVNTTGRPIKVRVRATVASADRLVFLLNGVEILTSGYPGQPTSICVGNIDVPSGYSYSCNWTSATVLTWMELR